MSYNSRAIGGLMVLCVCLTIPTAKAEQSNFLAIIQNLHCAQSEQEAATILKTLSTLPAEPYGLPSETGIAGHHQELYAATVDIVLKVLYETSQRFPKLQETIDRTAMVWRYCEIINDGDLADLSENDNGEIEKREAIGPFPANKQGFMQWGFLRNHNKNAYIPEVLKSAPLYQSAHQDFVQRLDHLHCFPIIENELFSQSSKHQYSGFLRLSEPLGKGKPYPYSWHEECRAKPVQKAKPKAHQPTSPQHPPKTAIAKNEPFIVVDVPKTPTLAKAETQNPIVKTQQTQKNPVPKRKFKKAKQSFLTNLIADKYVPPGRDELPVLSTAIPSGGSNMSAPLPLPPADGLGIAGNFFHRAALTGAMTVGTNASWHPYSYFFVRGGLSYNYLPGSGLSYSWGIGYDDWHPGTFSAQLNSWGPIKPGDDPLKGAVANFGYKFVAEYLKPYHLSGSASLNVPLSGNPSISTTWVWSPIEHWFVRVSLSKSLTNLNGLDWSYSFGYSDWRPFTFSLTYDNWGSNPILGSNQGDGVNFIKNGAVTLSWSWAF